MSLIVLDVVETARIPGERRASPVAAPFDPGPATLVVRTALRAQLVNRFMTWTHRTFSDDALLQKWQILPFRQRGKSAQTPAAQPQKALGAYVSQERFAEICGITRWAET
jgi:hypothetical protein